MEISKKNVAKWVEDHNDWEPDKAQKFQDFVIQFYQDGVDGLISEEALAILEKGFNYDGDVADAHDIGVVKGRNEKIVAEKLSKEAQSELLPEHASGKNTPPPPAPVKKEKPFGAKFIEDVL